MLILFESILHNLALECLSFHRMAAITQDRNAKLDALSKRNFIKSKMIWQYGQRDTYQAFLTIDAEDLFGPLEYELKGSVKCCIRYQRKMDEAILHGEIEKREELIESLDFLLAKLIWQHGTIKTFQALEVAGFNPIQSNQTYRPDNSLANDEIRKLQILIDNL
jgi:hypothetical protein